MKKLSIIIPYYNGGHYIGNLLEDLIQQDFKEEDYEIIVVDDGSTEPVDVLKSYCEQYHQISYIRQDHLGVSTARNTGIAHSTGKYIFFCDCDDRVRKHALSQLCELAETHCLEMLFHDHQDTEGGQEPQNVEGEGLLDEISSGTAYYAKHPDMRPECWNYMIMRSFVEKHHLQFPVQVGMHEDVVFLVEALLVAECVSHVGWVNYYYVHWPQSTINYSGRILKAERVAEDRLWVIKWLLGVLSNSPDIQCAKSMKRRVSNLSFQMLHQAFRYLPAKKSKDLIRRLRQIGGYPFEEGRYISKSLHMTYRVMQVYPLWMTCCYIYHLLPKDIRIRY